LFGAPLPFFVRVFRIDGLREYSETLVAKISAIIDLTQLGGDESQQRYKQRMVAAVTDSPNVMRKTRSEFLSDGFSAFAY
jgi:hypothetical protein